MKKRVIIVLIILMIVAVIFFIVYKNVRSGSEEEISSLPINYIENQENTIAEDNLQENDNEEKDDNQEKIEQITENQGLQGNTNFYELVTEYDGRETLTIKPWIQYQVALIGAIKKSTPEFSEMNQILEIAPKHTGIWVTESSRDKFLEILKSITKADYEITDDGYLLQKEKAFMNKYDSKIGEMLKQNCLYVFDINSNSYLVDEVTGKIRRISF